MAAPTPPFRLLLHSRDGHIPHLTPSLLRLIFSQDDDNESEEWKWYRRHVILGVAVKDTAVTPLYKRKNENGDKRGGKRIKAEDGSAKEIDDGESSKAISDKKKPSGYTFLTADKTRAICEAVASNLHSKEPKLEDESNANNNEDTSESNYKQNYLRIPSYVQTIIVPTFLFATEADEDSKSAKKFISKQYQLSDQSDPKQQQQQQKQQGTKKQIIPSGTVNAAAIDTPHGWQCITPEQYGGAATSLGNSLKSVDNLGVVGLFDYLDFANEANILFKEHVSAEALRKQASKKITTSFQKCTSWVTRMQNTMSDTLDCKDLPIWVPVNIFSSFLPEHVLSKCFLANNHKSGQAQRHNILAESSHVAIVGWESFPSHVQCKQKRQVLHKLMQSIQSMPTSESQKSPKQFLVLAVNDVASILDAAREGVLIIGTDLAREMSCKGAALVLDFNMPEASVTIESTRGKNALRGNIDLNETQYATDNKPILQGCTCLTCRPRKAHNRPLGYQHFQNKTNHSDAAVVPSFSRAYIHHLIQAKEMLADTLLFIHNLHQMVLLFRGLSTAASVDSVKDGSNSDGTSNVDGTSRLQSFCDWVQHQL